MRNKTVLLFLVAVLLLGAGCENPSQPEQTQPVHTEITYPHAEEAATYHSDLVQKQRRIGEALGTISKALSQKLPENEVQAIRETALDSTKKIIQETESMPDFQGNSDLKSSGLALFRFYSRTIEESYPRIITLSLKKEGEVDEMLELAGLFEEIAAGEMPLDAAFREAEEEFSDEFGFPLQDRLE